MPRLGIYINKRGTYVCEKCKEEFRLKMALINHKCSEKDNGLGKSKKRRGQK